MPTKETSRYHHGNLRVTLLEAALQQLSEQTVDTLSLRGLAKAAGVSVAAVYRHFPNKNALLAQVAADGFNRLNAQWERRLPQLEEAGAAVRLQRLGEIYIEFGLASPAHFRLMFGQGDLSAFPELRAAAEKCFGYVLSAARDTVVAAGAADSWARPMANAAWSMVHGYVHLSLDGLLSGSNAGPDLPHDLLTRFLRLPDEALPPGTSVVKA